MIYALFITLYIGGGSFYQITVQDFPSSQSCSAYAREIAEDFIDTGFVEGLAIDCLDLKMRSA